ncbi:MAG: hypothetical protein B7Y39_09035 [Bdellovibrio sp. 28-41-41]|nr:MAG: hypothetical protein B7Y39_09035 [Bdellovibrio sp. 28-41-41]
MIKSALLKNTKAFIYLTTDGAMGSTQSDIPGAAWVADRGVGGIQVFVLVDPAAAIQSKNYFIGAFSSDPDAQAVDPNSIAGNDTEKAAAIVVCNYIHFDDPSADCSGVIKNKLTADEIIEAKVLK